MITQFSYGLDNGQAVLGGRVHQDDPERDILSPSQRDANGVNPRNTYEFVGRLLGEHRSQLAELFPLGHLISLEKRISLPSLFGEISVG